MGINYAIIGGDLRIIELAKMLAEDGNIIYTYGLEKTDKLQHIKNIISCESIEQAIKNVKIVIGPIPFTTDGKNINSPFSQKNIEIQEIFCNINGKTLIAGNIKKEINVIDIMEQEELTILNVIATAEGAIQVAMENTDRILHGSNVLILGFGRIGKILAKKLEGLSCNVTCSARKREDFAWIKAYGYKQTDTNTLGENLSQFDIIINTIPHLILDKNKLKYVKKECLLIDLASKPGGIDTEFAKQMGIETIWALALPGKVAPKTSAEFIRDSIYHILREKGEEIKC